MSPAKAAALKKIERIHDLRDKCIALMEDLRPMALDADIERPETLLSTVNGFLHREASAALQSLGEIVYTEEGGA